MKPETARDLLLPGLAYREAMYGGRIAGDIEVTEGGNLSLRMVAGERTAHVHLASPDTIENGEFKTVFVPLVEAAFGVMDQLLHPDADPPGFHSETEHSAAKHAAEVRAAELRG